jgi:ferredoxin
MEMDKFPGRIWVVAHKPVAVAAGLGVMGIRRNVIHPKFGNFILLATILVDQQISAYGQPLDYSPCLECKLCVAACPVGAIGKDGEFDFRSRVSDSENASMWQSLSFKANYKAAYCLAVCPVGEEVQPQAWTMFWAGSMPSRINNSVASAACSQIVPTSGRSAAAKFSSTNVAPDLRPGGRPIPIRTR